MSYLKVQSLPLPSSLPHTVQQLPAYSVVRGMVGCAAPVSISCWIKWVLPMSEGEVAKTDRNSYSNSHNCCCCFVDIPSLLFSITDLIVSSWVGGFCEIPHVTLPLTAALLVASSPVRHGWRSRLDCCGRCSSEGTSPVDKGINPDWSSSRTIPTHGRAVGSCE